MGLLSDPEKSPFLVKNLPRHYAKLSIISFLAGIIWLLLLVDENFNQKTYFSENALLPGLVNPEYTTADEQFAKEQHRFLLDLKKKSPNSVPYEEIKGAFQQLGLEVYDHFYNFTSLGFSHGDLGSKSDLPTANAKGQSEIMKQGRNIYAILRAPRGNSLESIVLSAPYRFENKNHRTFTGTDVKPKLLQTDGGIAALLSLAQLFRYKSYWAKDIIFLVTDNEHIGAKAWVEAYHGVKSKYITSTPLENRAGAIQATINLEVPGPDINYLDLRIVGINGQMPNLDLVNLVKHLFLRDGMPITFQNNTNLLDASIRGFPAVYLRDLETVARIVAVAARGQVEGNHAFFQQFQIQSLTIRGMKSSKLKAKIGFRQLGITLEGVTRSLNNLLERFHQSFFFYLPTSTNRFISIGLYMAPYGLLVLPAALTALTLWIHAAGYSSDNVETPQHRLQLGRIFTILPGFLIAHWVGLVTYFLILNAPVAMLPIVVLCTSFFGALPMILKLVVSKPDAQLLKSLGLIEMIVGLYALSMLNFPLALLITFAIVPVYSFNPQKPGSLVRTAQVLAWISVNPFLLQFLAGFLKLATGNVPLVQGDFGLDRMSMSVSEFREYGNWMFPVVTLFLLPLWIIHGMAFCNTNGDEIVLKLTKRSEKKSE